MAIKKKKSNGVVVLEKDSLERWVGKVDERLRVNDEFHKTLWETINQQHKETISKIEDVCGTLVPMQKDLTSACLQIKTDTERIDVLENEVNGTTNSDGLKQKISSLQTKAGYISAVVGGGISAIILLGKYLFAHLTGNGK